MNKAVETAIKMLDTLPEDAQDRVVEALAILVEEARDEAEWNDLFTRKAEGLAAAARLARSQIAAGNASPMDYNKL